VTSTPRVTFVASTLAYGGAERIWALLIPRLAARGFAVRVVTLMEEGAFFHQLAAQGIDVTCAHMRNRFDLRGLRRAFDVLRHGTDLIVSQSVNAQTVGVFMARKASVPHVTIDHAGPGLALRLHRRLLLRFVARRVDLLIAVSSLQLSRLLPFGFDPERIVIIPNGSVPLVPTETRDETRLRLGVEPDAFLALLVADLRPVKNAVAFVGGVARAHAEDPRIRGLIVGDGPERAGAEAAAAASGGAVALLGARGDVAELMNAADAICLTSHTEGQPLVVLEAMSLGRPVVATRVGGLTELVSDEETGLLVPDGDLDAFASALRALADDPALQQRLGDAGKERHAALFSADRMADDYAGALRAVIERRAATH
jgi:glycosyltransferase involved in cell wall biosynthesis